jgi:hypothetical protein
MAVARAGAANSPATVLQPAVAMLAATMNAMLIKLTTTGRGIRAMLLLAASMMQDQHKRAGVGGLAPNGASAVGNNAYPLYPHPGGLAGIGLAAGAAMWRGERISPAMRWLG